MKCRECNKSGAANETWGLCKRCYKDAVKFAEILRKG
jgi:hypothetical protein